MQKPTTSQEAAFLRVSEIARPAHAYRKSPGARREAQRISKNPVILALRRIEKSQLETDRHAAGKARIAYEVIEQLGWSNAAPANSSDGIAVRALRERRNREQVSRMRAQLDAYLSNPEEMKSA